MYIDTFDSSNINVDRQSQYEMTVRCYMYVQRGYLVVGNSSLGCNNIILTNQKTKLNVKKLERMYSKLYKHGHQSCMVILS